MKRALLVLVSLLLLAGASAAQPVAVIPTQIIYPGDTVESHMLEIVAVTNKRIRRDYASSIDQVAGMVARRTLLPGRVIPVSSVREPHAVERGGVVTMVFSQGGLTIMAPGTPLQSGAIGEFIRVRNVNTGIIVSGTVMADGTVRVALR